MLDTRDKPFFWEFKNTYERGDQYRVVKGSFTTDYCNKAVIHFTSSPPGYGSHKGKDGTHYGVVSVVAVNQYSQVVYNTTKTMWTWLGGDSQGNARKNEDILNMSFKEPVKITYEWNLDLGGFIAHCYGGQNWVSVVKNLHMTINCNLTTNGMQGLRILKKDYEAFFPFRTTYINSKYLTFKNQNVYKYLDMTTDSGLTSHPNITIQKNGIVYYIQDRYSSNNFFASGNFYNKAYKPSRPIKYTVTIPINNYPKYIIAINGNFDVNGWFDFNNSSWNDCSHFKGNFSMPVNPINGGGHRWSGYNVTQVSDPSSFDMTYPPNTMRGELNIVGNISSVSGSDQQIFYRQMTNSRGDGVYVSFRVYIRKNGNNLFITYGWWLAGYDERCNGNASYSIKVGVATHE